MNAAAPVDTVFHARLFGTLALAAPDGSNALPSGRKGRAVLACLLLAGGDGMTRERLAAMLWSRSGEEQARASLRQTLHELRSIGGLLVADRVTVRIAPGRVRTDVDLVGEAARQTDPAAVKRVAEAFDDGLRDLLSDLDGIDDAFDEWLLVERRRLGDARRAALLAAGDVALNDGDAAHAQHLASMMLAADPIDEAAARLSMRAAHGQGDRDHVRVVHSRLAEALSSGLDAAPSAETAELHRRLMAERRTVEPAIVDPVAPVGPTVMPDRTPSRRRTWRATIAALSVLVVVGAGWWSTHRTPAVPRDRVLLVKAAAADAGDSAARAVADGLSSDLARMIVGNDTRLVVAADEAARRADFLVAGDTRTDGGTLRLNVRLRRPDDAAILWSASFARPVAEVAAFREQVATTVGDVLTCAIGGRRPLPDDADVRTLQLYFGACETKHTDWAEAARLLEQVVARRPDYAHGWAMLAAGTSVAAYSRPAQADALHDKARAYAKHALDLDPTDGEAFFAQADALPGIGEWTKRMAILEQGHAVDPTNSSINGAIGYELPKVGRLKEAIAAAQRAVDEDPFSPVHIATLAQARAFGTPGDDGERTLTAGRVRFPTVAYFMRADFRIAAFQGDPRRAAAVMKDPRLGATRDPLTAAAWSTFLQARIDPSPAAIDAAVAAIRAQAEAMPVEVVSSMAKLAVLGRVDEAYALAERLDTRSGAVEMLFSKPMATFRADPRFMPVAAKAGVVSIWLQTDRWPDFCEDKSLPWNCRAEAKRVGSK